LQASINTHAEWIAIFSLGAHLTMIILTLPYMSKELGHSLFREGTQRKSMIFLLVVARLGLYLMHREQVVSGVV